MTAAMSKDGAQLLQGIQKLDQDVQELKGRMSRLEGRMDKFEGRMDKLEGRMDKLESSNGQILDHVKRIVKVLTEPPAPGQTRDGLNAYLSTIERRLTGLKR